MRMKHAFLILLLPALLLAASATAGQLRTTATEKQFLIHVDANKSSPKNCGGAEWSTPQAFCEGSSAPSAHSYEFYPGAIDVSWCTAGTAVCTMGKGHQLPSHHYTRWMKFCEWQGVHECPSHANWVLGAVVMPNGPFAVVAGHLGGKAIEPTSSDQTKISHQGGPLHLVVSDTGFVSNGGGVPASNGYTFGLIGWIRN
jgi:hypothetical protein